MVKFIVSTLALFFVNATWAKNVQVKCRTTKGNVISYRGSDAPGADNRLGQQVLWIDGIPQKQYRYSFDDFDGTWSVTVATVHNSTTLRNYRINFLKVETLNMALEISLNNVSTGHNETLEKARCIFE